MEEFCVILAHHSLIGEVARAKLYLNSQAANTLAPEARQVLSNCFGLVTGSITDSMAQLKQIKSPHYQQMVELVELLYLNSCAIKETDKMEVLRQNIDLEASSIPSQVLTIGFVACCVFDPKMYVSIFEQYAGGDETLNAMLFICELFGQQTPSKLDKFGQHFNEQNVVSQLANYACMMKKLVSQPEGVKAVFNGALKMRSQLFFADQHDAVQLAEMSGVERFSLLGYLNQARMNAGLADYIKQSYTSPFNQLILNLCMANYPTEPEAIVAINQYLDILVEKVVGRPYLPQQKEHLISQLIQIARAFPTAQCLGTLSDFIKQRLEINKYKQLHLLLAYFIGISALLTGSTQQALKAIEHFNEVFNTADVAGLTGIENFCLRTDDVFILIEALVGRFDDVRAELSEVVRDDELDDEGREIGQPLVAAIVQQFEYDVSRRGENPVAELLHKLLLFASRVRRRRFTGRASQVLDVSYGYCLHDTLAYSVISNLVLGFYNTSAITPAELLDTGLLMGVRAFYDDLYAVSFSSKPIRVVKMFIYNNLQIYDQLLRDSSDLSSFASGEGNIAISTQELIIAASAAAELYKHDEASTYTSQALILDPGVEKSAEYAKVVAKICAAKGDYKSAIEKLQIVLDGLTASHGDSYKLSSLVPIRIHIALLKIKAGELLSGFDIFKELNSFYPLNNQVINIEMNAENADYLAMHVNIEKAKAILYILRESGMFQKTLSARHSNINQSSFDELLEEHEILFFEVQNLVDKFNDSLLTTFQEGNTMVGTKYIAAAYGPCPIITEQDIFQLSTEKVNEQQLDIYQRFAQQEKLSIETAVKHTKPYLQYSLEATEILSEVHLIFLGDKVGYVQCYNELIKSVPSTTRLAALASAHLSVGNAKQAQEFYQKAITMAQSVIKANKISQYIETLIIAFLNILRSRSLSRCHRYMECEETVRRLLECSSMDPIPPTADNEQRNNGIIKLIVYAIVSIEYMKLLIKLREYSNLNSIIDQILVICQEKFDLPLDLALSNSVNQIPLPVVYLAIYCTRAKAQLIQQQHLPMPTAERLNLLEKACYYCDNNILIKTQRVLPAKLDLKIKMCENVFSTQQTTIINEQQFNTKELIGIRGLVLLSELRVELAEYYLDAAKIDLKQIGVGSTQTFGQLTHEKKNYLQKAYENASQSLKASSARGNIICAVYELYINQNLEQAREYALVAKSIEMFNPLVSQIIQVISHKMNFDNEDDEVESEKANTPFEDATKILKTSLNVDRVAALDRFLLNSCLIHDMTVVTDALFATGDHEEEEAAGAENILQTDFENLQELNDRSKKIVSTNFDGYFYLGRGFLSLKMGRVEDAFRDLLSAVNSQTLNDRYRCRALYLLATIYINPARAPLYGAHSCLTGKQQSAVALEKAALNNEESNNVNFIDDEVQQVDNEDIIVPDIEVINQRDEDLEEAIAILDTIEELVIKDVPEAEELAAVLRGLIRVGEYQESKDKIARVLEDDGKTVGRTKLQQLERVKDEAKAEMAEQCEALHVLLNKIDKNGPNYVVIMYTLGVLYTQLKNEAKARSSFTTGSREITSIRELGASAQQQEAQLWLDVDASVQCNLALSDQYICIGKITNALRSLDSVAALDKIQTISYELYGLCMEKESAFEDAVKYYESAWLLSKGSPSVAYRLAYNYMKASKFQDAVLMCQTALSEWPQFMKLRKEVLFKAEQHIKTSRVAK